MFEKIMFHIYNNIIYVVISILLYMTGIIKPDLCQFFTGLSGFILILFAAEVTHGVRNHENFF